MPIELAPHQREAVERVVALLQSCGGALLADDVGLGKSFVAAAVAARTNAHVEVIAPAGLLAQWEETLDAFGVEARITTHDRVLSEPFTPQIETDRLIIVDEAHAFRNPQTQRYDALARRSIGARLLLVTATPICNAADDLQALISLIAADDSLRARGVASIETAFAERREEEIAVVLDAMVIRRGREVLDDRFHFGALKRSVVRYQLPRCSIDDLRFPLLASSSSLLQMVLWRRLESSEAALLESLRRQKRFYERALDCLASGRTLTRRDYRMAFDDEETYQEILFWELFATEAARIQASEIEEELARLNIVRGEIEATPRTKAALIRVSDPTLIFTSAIATATDLYTTLSHICNAGLITSHQAKPLDAIGAFQRGSLDVLIATDLAAEGLNLQRAATVVHYDMPWNPVKLDQRNGRAVRIGQTRPAVRAIYFVPRGRRTRIVKTIASKNRVRRALLSGAPPPSAASTQSLLALPARISKTASAAMLSSALRAALIDPPPAIHRRYRAGMERLLAEMAHEYIDAHRVSDLTALIERERIIEGEASRGSADR